MNKTVEAIIVGAGIAGISAFYLAVKQGLRDILIIDEKPPLSLTSDKSTECYRNWWPGSGNAMVALMNRNNLPEYSQDFLLSRFDNPDYLKKMMEISSTGQL